MVSVLSVQGLRQPASDSIYEIRRLHSEPRSMSVIGILQQSGRKLSSLGPLPRRDGLLREAAYTRRLFQCLFGVCPAGNPPSCLRAPQSHGKRRRLLDRFATLLIRIRQRTDKICAISIHVNGLGRPELAAVGRDSALIVIREVSLPPICACSWAVPLMRRKFVEN